MLASQCRPFAQDNLILAKLIRPRRWPGCGRSPAISIPTTSFASSVRQRRRRAAGARRAADDPRHPRAGKTGRPLLKQGHRTRAASRSDSSSAVIYLERLRAAGALDGEAAEITYSRPVCIVTGRQDRIAGYLQQPELLERYPHATFAVIDSAGHFVRFERPVLFRSLLCTWLERCPARRRGGRVRRAMSFRADRGVYDEALMKEIR
jgi:pimeloyl-ACP methyl ester carboxylesterase